MYVFDNGYSPTATKLLKWNGKEYDINQVFVVVKGIPYSVSSLKSGSKTKEMHLWNDELKKGEFLYGNFDEVDSMIDNIIPIQMGPQKEELVYDSPNAMSLTSGVIWYVIAMVGGLIFKDFILIWIGASLVFWPWFLKKPRFKD